MEVIKNKKAKFNYQVYEKLEAGIKLVGSEIKSIREKKCSIDESYITIKKGEVYLLNATISKFDKSSFFNHAEKRERKLLLNKREIIKLEQKTKKEGFTIIPLSFYFKGSLLKVEIALCKGKKTYDKRDAIKKEEETRKIKKAIKNFL